MGQPIRLAFHGRILTGLLDFNFSAAYRYIYIDDSELFWEYLSDCVFSDLKMEA